LPGNEIIPSVWHGMIPYGMPLATLRAYSADSCYVAKCLRYFAE